MMSFRVIQILFNTLEGLCSVIVTFPSYPYNYNKYPESILSKSIAGRYRPVRVADGPITARCRFIKNASLVDYKRNAH